MPKIRLLDPHTIDKIAAGEVVERPASVVKELVENSLDAGAKAITIELRDGGKQLIKVSDDGCGMAPEDAELAFERHATSKLRKIEDLERLRTLGFRGEALSSIAAVAKVEMLTRAEAEDVGTMVTVNCGSLVSVSQVARERGTSIYVRDLFGNVPARRKFLKGTRAELALISEIVGRTAIAHPDVSFTFAADGKELVSTRGDGDGLNAVSSVLGKDKARDLIPLRAERGGTKLKGFVAKPSVTRSSAQSQLFFVNSRPIHSPLLTEAVSDGYSGLVMKGRHPVVVIMLDIMPSSVDVNVHPAKREVRFKDEQEVYEFVEGAVRSALASARLIPEPMARSRDADAPKISQHALPSDGVQTSLAVGEAVEKHKVTAVAEEEDIPLPRDAKAVGQILNTYIIVEHSDGLILLDQHASHERVVFESLKAIRGQSHARQTLLSPLTVELEPGKLELAKDILPLLSELGFELEPFGTNTALVRALPVVAGELEDAERLHDLIDDLARVGKAKGQEAKRDELLHRVACHAAIRAGDALSQERMQRLIAEMRRLRLPYTCPHGRPVAISLSRRDLERMFGRAG